jgi:hypothetical protein
VSGDVKDYPTPPVRNEYNHWITECERVAKELDASFPSSEGGYTDKAVRARIEKARRRLHVLLERRLPGG